MDSIDEALKMLNAAISKAKARDKERFTEIAGQLSTHLVLLKLSTISEQVSDKLSKFLRESVSTLYAGVPLPALQVASAIFETVYHGHILSAIGGTRQEQKEKWEVVLYALLSGILDFLDEHTTKEMKDAIGDALFQTLSDMCLSLSAPRTSVDLRCTAYNILVDAAALHPVNQSRLRDPKILGAERLGWCIWRTRDYLALEGLLNLFARALPSTNGSAAGRAQRTAYIRSVFEAPAPPELLSIGEEITNILEHVPSSDWEETSVKIVNALAKGNIAYPQPFNVDEIVVTDVAYPSDRLYVDCQTFLANVLLEDQQYDSLEIAYSTVDKISIRHNHSRTRTQITLSLKSGPRLGKDPIKMKNTNAPIIAMFVLQPDQETRFLQVLECRGIHHLTSHSPQHQTSLKSSIAAEPAKLELDSAGRLVEELSQSERIENLSQFYRTNEPSDDILSAGDLDDFSAAPDAAPIPIDTSEPSVGPLAQAAQGRDGLNSGNADEISDKPVPGALLCRTRSQLVREAAFGTDGEDLSDISECDSPMPPSKVLRRTSTTASLLRGRISFDVVSTKTVVTSTPRLARGYVGKVVLDSYDGDDSPALDPRAHSRHVKKVLMPQPTADTPGPTTDDLAKPVPSCLLDAPAQSAATLLDKKGEVDSSVATSGLRSGNRKILRFSDPEIPAPDFHAPLSSPPVVPKSVLKKVTRKNPVHPRGPEQSLLLDSSPPHAPATRSRRSTVVLDPVFCDLGPPSSSPTPGGKKAVKASLKKKNTIPPKPVKRKEPSADEVEDITLAPTENDASHTAKRPRPTTVESNSATQVQRDGGMTLRSLTPDKFAQASRSAVRVRKRYRAKGRMSSPSSGSRSGTKGRLVDYDELPSPPSLSTAHAHAKASSPVAVAVAVAKAIKIDKGTKAENVLKEQMSAKMGASGKTSAKKEDIDQVAKTGKPDNKKGELAKTEDAMKRDEEKRNKNKVTGSTPSPVLPRPRKKVVGTSEDEQQKIPPKGKENVATVVQDVSIVSPYVSNGEPTNEGPAGCKNTVELTGSASVRRTPVQKRIGAVVDASAVHSPKGPSEPNRPCLGPPRIEAETEIITPPRDVLSSGRKPPVTNTKRDETSNKMPWDAVVEVSESSIPMIEETSLVAVVSGTVDNVYVDGARVTARCGPANTSVKDDKPVSPLKTQIEALTLSSTMQPKPATDLADVSGDATIVKHSSPNVTGADIIDLTGDSPKADAVQLPTLMVDQRSSTRFSSQPCQVDNDSVPTRQYLPEPITIPFSKQQPAVRSTLPSKVRTMSVESEDMPPQSKTAVSDNRKQQSLRSGAFTDDCHDICNKRGRVAEDGTFIEQDIYEDDAGMHGIVEVLDKIHEVIVQNIRNKFEGIRHDARVGQAEILRQAAADLHSIRADSIIHFNRLVDLEAEYAEVGRNVIHGTEDWMKVNQETCKELAAALEKHDRGMLSKKMPPTLIPLRF